MSGSGDAVDQLLVTIQAALDSTGVYVAPTMATQVGEEQLDRIEAAVARSPEPVFVVLYPFAYDDAFGGNPGDLLSRLHDASGQPGVYIAHEIGLGGDDVTLEPRVWGPGSETNTDSYEIAAVGREQSPDDLGSQLVAVTEAIADGTLDEQYDALPSVVASRTGSSTGSPGDDGGSATPYVVSGGALLALVLIVVLSRRKARPRPRPQAATAVPRFTLPVSVLERARDAQDLQLTRRAHREVLALGESIDAAEMSSDDPPRAWQAALDRYEAARRIHGDPTDGDAPEEVDVLDVAGAIVLGGRQALDAAVEAREFTPVVTCFLDPLHGQGTARGAIERDGEEVRVPLCKRCRTALKTGRRPDILDVVWDGKAVHYFETDAEPWASTGFGALSPDLVERLHRG